MRTYLKCAAACAALIASTSVSAQSTAWDIDTPSGFTNSSWSFGDVFTVGSQDIQVFGLGAFDHNLDGFVTSGGIQVGLYDELTSTLLASTNVLSSDTLIGNYRFGSIAPLTLFGGTQYRVAAVSGSDLYNVTTGTPNGVNSLITWNRYGYCNTSTLQSCNVFTGTERSWMANLQLSPVSGAVPEPATWAMMLLGFAFVGGAMRKTRRKPKLSVSFA